ncbi:MAG: ATP-binding protein [Alphaproteobacteria bacterium]|jgi:Na+/proline symporter/nitrogen-specific signal transduction histidine kinase
MRRPDGGCPVRAMLSANLVFAVSLGYVALLFFVAYLGDKRARAGQLGLFQSPLIYTLSISVYCTSWTFYGAVGSAVRSGMEFITIYTGPTIVFIGFWFLLRKLVRIGRVHRITSIADLISSRYGKGESLAVLVTLIAIVGSTPYIALQLKAVTTSFQVISGGGFADPDQPVFADPDYTMAFWIAAGMAVFTIVFGTRNIDANERHHGVVAAIALEALVKLFALIAVGLFVVFYLADGPSEIFSMAPPGLLNTEEVFGPRWITLTFLAATAVICLPRQFQVTVVENADERHLYTASWMFPLYLLLISLFVLPIAIGGLTFLPETANPDMFVLTLPMAMNQDLLALIAFLGGFSSATSMVIVACIALSTMVSNHVVMPLALRLPWVEMKASGDVRRLLLISRRTSICLVLLLGFVYFRLSAKSDALAAIGLIAFVGVAQFLPSLIGGLYWRQASAKGAFAGLLAGFLIWLYTLFLPSFEGAFLIPLSVIENGPWGISFLRPEALFGLEGMDPLVHALFWSLCLNTLIFVIVSLIFDPKPLERLQGALFIDVFRTPADNEARFIRRYAASNDLFVVAQRILGTESAYRVFSEFAQNQGVAGHLPRADDEFIGHLERELAGSVGAATARAMILQVVKGETISLDELMKIVDETQQVIDYSRQLEVKSHQLQQTARQLREANERLKQLDVQKDDFLSQVSHELRTPMTSIRSFAQILLDTPDMDEKETKRFTGIILEESQRLTRLLDEILDLARLEGEQIDWELHEIDASEALERAIATCQGLAAQSNVTLEFRDEAKGTIIEADDDRLRQVFLNLITNAIKYNSSPEPKVTVLSAIENGRYCVSVEDNGAGIRAEDRERIFQKFSRGWRQSKDGRSGTGLGLAISWQIMQRLRGDLELLPQEDGTGARFKISLPCKERAAAE